MKLWMDEIVGLCGGVITCSSRMGARQQQQADLGLVSGEPPGVLGEGVLASQLAGLQPPGIAGQRIVKALTDR